MSTRIHTHTHPNAISAIILEFIQYKTSYSTLKFDNPCIIII